MLEPSRFVVRERARSFTRARTFDILDGYDRIVGTAVEAITPAALLYRLLGMRDRVRSRTEVREPPDGSLVFTVHRVGSGRCSRAQVFDALGGRVGTFLTGSRVDESGTRGRDRGGVVSVAVAGDITTGELRVLATDPVEEYARVTVRRTSAAGLPFAPAVGMVVELSDDAHDQPIIKMIVLAVSLTMAADYDRADSRSGLKLSTTAID